MINKLGAMYLVTAMLVSLPSAVLRRKGVLWQMFERFLRVFATCPSEEGRSGLAFPHPRGLTI
ncbi:hypothetical protein J2Z48_000342 [Croceifilum oryzae]|uniref:Uncharacterized protein n=1 Tax=Croceifilum oryzae TaxID=1553429 RepID=A0AAJ1TD31_9BACL|nr:hypothetical protein [Croceifilum oryzae]MDQ0416184.1 hypothetical protein [Croceifilum oryzae]